MKKKKLVYEEPVLSFVIFGSTDIINTSDPGGIGYEGNGEDDIL